MLKDHIVVNLKRIKKIEVNNMVEEEKNDNKKDSPKAPKVDNNLITYVKKSLDDE